MNQRRNMALIEVRFCPIEKSDVKREDLFASGSPAIASVAYWELEPLWTNISRKRSPQRDVIYRRSGLPASAKQQTG